MTNISTDTVLILDFGSQVTQLIARRVREAGVYCEIVPFSKGEEGLRRLRAKGDILSGGAAGAYDIGTPKATEKVFVSGLPVLGICYGEQTMVAQLGGEVIPSSRREFGRAEIEAVDDCALFEGVWPKGTRDQVWMSHGDRIERIPPGFRVVALFRRHYNIPLVRVDAGETFLAALAGVSDPERKRKIIGNLFIDVFEGEARKLGGAEFLAQGTLYPDVIESVSF